MKISFELNETEFSAEDQRLLNECLKNDSGVAPSKYIEKIAKTAFCEYCKMFKEKGLPTRADEVQQERLFFLLKHYYIDHLPTEAEISSIFQLTHSQSATLLRNTLSRNRIKINDFIENTLKKIITEGKKLNDRLEFIIYSRVVVEELNLIVSQKGPGLEQIKKIKDTASKYSCPVDTYNLLKQELKING